MGGITSVLGSGLQNLFQVMSAGSAENTALNTAFLSQQYQMEAQDTFLQMGLSQIQNDQLQTSLMGKAVTTVYGEQQKMNQDYFKTTTKAMDGWIQSLGGGRG